MTLNDSDYLGTLNKKLQGIDKLSKFVLLIEKIEGLNLQLNLVNEQISALNAQYKNKYLKYN